MNSITPWMKKSKKAKARYMAHLTKLYGDTPLDVPAINLDSPAPRLDIPAVPKIPTEEQEQIKLAVWLAKQGIKFTASANGGKRSMTEAIRFKRMGVSAGFPDISIPLPSGPYHGLYIELKRIKGGRLSPEQIEWLEYLRSKGYCAECCAGFEAARDLIIKYLNMTPQAA